MISPAIIAQLGGPLIQVSKSLQPGILRPLTHSRTVCIPIPSASAKCSVVPNLTRYSRAVYFALILISQRGHLARCRVRMIALSVDIAKVSHGSAKDL